MSLPTGDPANGAYDSLGGFYQLPEHVVSDPTNIVTSPSHDAEGITEADKSEEGGGSSDEVDEEELLRRREEKGKAVVDPKDMIVVHARPSSGGPDLKINVAKTDSVRSLERRVFEESGVSALDHVKILANKEPSFLHQNASKLPILARF